MQALDYPRCHRPFGAVIKAAGEVTQGAIRCDAIFEEHEMETPNVSRLQWCSVAGSGAIIEAPLEVILDTSEAVESRPDVMGDPLSLHLHMSFPKPLILIESIDPTGVLTLEDRRLFNFLLTASWRSLGRGECGPLSAPTSRLRSRIGQGRERSNRRIERSFQRLAATKTPTRQPDRRSCKRTAIPLLGLIAWLCRMGFYSHTPPLPGTTMPMCVARLGSLHELSIEIFLDTLRTSVAAKGSRRLYLGCLLR